MGERGAGPRAEREVTMRSPDQVNVLAIDGGGIRGIIPAMILAELERRLQSRLCDAFDVIAGTSTGGILALGLGTASKAPGEPYAAEELLDLYLSDGARIFPGGPRWRWRGIFSPLYPARPLEQVLRERFGDTRLSAALTALVIPTYDLQMAGSFFFKTGARGALPAGASDHFVRDAARATSAAPTYFRPLLLADGARRRVLIDGGVVANNPAMAAYAEARNLFPMARRIVVVSAGTGERKDSVSYADAKGWGLLAWAGSIAPVLLEGDAAAVDYEVRALASPACDVFRFQPSLAPGETAMDDPAPANLQRLEATARQLIASQAGRLDAACAALAAAKMVS
jgi:patatin-like phospholipase/acyl hydrolase